MYYHVFVWSMLIPQCVCEDNLLNSVVDQLKKSLENVVICIQIGWLSPFLEILLHGGGPGVEA